MRIAEVEIYSDATNAAVMRHPGRRFPGLLIQGDTLARLVREVESVRAGTAPGSEAREEADHLCDSLRGLLDHYRTVLTAHDLPLPFRDV